RGDTRFVIACHFEADSIDIGASICCAGACLTVVEKTMEDGRTCFAVDASAETLDKTNLGEWKEGTLINLERSLCIGDELGGHIVTGHVDAVGKVISRSPEGDSFRFVFEAPNSIAPFIAQKGSITLNGTSLTVNEVEGSTFGVNLIPHTLDVTTWGKTRPGDRINMEIDILARYVARMVETGFVK
ncbi:MAG TPA: riboflavin synthase, partial [Rhizobiales bacterium]|nr:riboflavin synthase [Hyphomicrobiales bacterium]